MMEAPPSGSYSTDKYVPFPLQQCFDSMHVSAASRKKQASPARLVSLSPFGRVCSQTAWLWNCPDIKPVNAPLLPFYALPAESQPELCP